MISGDRIYLQDINREVVRSEVACFRILDSLQDNECTSFIPAKEL